MKGALSAQKALQGSKTETRELLGGTEENIVSRRGVIDLPMIFYLAPLYLIACDPLATIMQNRIEIVTLPDGNLHILISDLES